MADTKTTAGAAAPEKAKRKTEKVGEVVSTKMQKTIGASKPPRP